MAKAKSTPVPLLEQSCCGNEVYIALHFGGGSGGEILGVFTNEKAGKKCAIAAKKEDGHKGKEAKEHLYTVVAWSVDDKFDG